MRVFVLCFAVLAVANSVLCITDSEEMLQSIKMNMLENYANKRDELNQIIQKVESLCPGYGNQFKTAMGKATQCWNTVDEDEETMCSTIKNHFEKCSKPLVSLFEECLPERSQDIPSFLVQATVAITDYLCKTDGEHIFELSNQCAMTQNYRTQRCIRKVQVKMQQFDRQSPSKEDVCEFLKSFKACFQSHLAVSCGHEKTREAFLGVYDAGLSICDANSELNEIDVVEERR